MKTRLLPLLGVALAAGLVPAGAAQDKKPKAPPPARVVLTDTLSGFSRGADKSLELRLQPQRGKGLLTGSIYVTVPADKVTGDIPPRKPVAFEGRLGTRNVQVGRTGSVPSRPILAKAVSLVADRYTLLDDKNRKDFPPVGSARVSGRAVHGKLEVGPGSVLTLAIANGNDAIFLTGKGLKGLGELAEVNGELRAEGKLRVERGTLVLDADRVERVGAKDGK
jgi:hypothetical protein